MNNSFERVFLRVEQQRKQGLVKEIRKSKISFVKHSRRLQINYASALRSMSNKKR